MSLFAHPKEKGFRMEVVLDTSKRGVCVLIGVGRGFCERMEGINGRGRVGAGLCFVMERRRIFLRKLPLLVFLPTVNVGGRDVVGIEFFVFSEVY